MRSLEVAFLACEDITIRNKLFTGQFEENASVDSTNTLISIEA